MGAKAESGSHWRWRNVSLPVPHVTGINLPISTYLIHGYMKSIPFELEEAAVIDGATFLQRFTKVVFPLSKSGLVTAGTFVFLFGWNEFIYALLLTSRQQGTHRPVRDPALRAPVLYRLYGNVRGDSGYHRTEHHHPIYCFTSAS